MPTADLISFVALGIPSPGGSKSAFRNPRTGRIVVVDAGGAKTKRWRSIVASAAREAMQGFEFIAPPIGLIIEFRMPRPKSHYTSSGELKRDAPWVPIVRPDLTKLLRSTEDAMTGIVWYDDAAIVEQVIHRAYALDEHSGARISVFTVKWKNGASKSKENFQEFIAETPSLSEIASLDKERRRSPVARRACASVDHSHQLRSERRQDAVGIASV